MRHYRLYLGFIICAAALVRLWFLVSSQWLVEGDEAAVGLQALHILRGERPIFFPGQSYLGNLESYLVALSFSSFEVSRFSIKIVPLLFSLVFIYLCAVIGTELVNDPSVGLATALAAAAPSVYVVMWSLKSRGGYIEALVIGQLALLWMFRWCKRRDVSGSPAQRSSPSVTVLPGAIFGFLCGYGIWLNPLLIYLFLPMGIVMILRLPDAARPMRVNMRSILSVFAGALVGILPLVLFRIAYGREIFARIEREAPPSSDWLPLTKRVWSYFWQDGLTTILGLRQPRAAFTPDWHILVVPLFACAVLFLFWRARQSTALMVIALTVLVAFPIFTYGSLTGGNAAVIIPDSGLLTRYLFPLYLPASIALGLFLVRVVLPVRAISIVAFVAVNLHGMLTADVASLAQNEFCNQPLPLSNQELIDFLTEHSLTRVYTNHWIGYPLMLESREHILTFDYPDTKYGMDRFPEYGEQVARAEHPALVVFNPHYNENPIDDELARLGISYEKSELKNYIVYDNLVPYFHPSMIETVLRWPYY